MADFARGGGRTDLLAQLSRDQLFVSLESGSKVQTQNWDGVLCVPHNADIVGQLNLPHNWRLFPLIFCGRCFDKLEFSFGKSLAITRFLSAAGSWRKGSEVKKNVF